MKKLVCLLLIFHSSVVFSNGISYEFNEESFNESSIAYLRALGVSYEFSGGRFGDNLIAYSKALWVSYKTNVPLLYRPFEYGNQLELSRLHQPLGDRSFASKVMVKTEEDIASMSQDGDTIYSVSWSTRFPIDWDNQEFKELLKKEIMSKRPLHKLTLPKDRLAVAVHLRTGSGQDKTLQIRKRITDRDYPHKFPPNSLYINQLKRLSELLDDQPLYVHLFTDSRNPINLVKLLKKEVNKPNIKYGYIKSRQRSKHGVLQDFFAMTQFKYFIRSQSSFSIMANYLSDWKIIIYPKQCVWGGNTVIVKEVVTLKRD